MMQFTFNSQKPQVGNMAQVQGMMMQATGGTIELNS